MKQLNEDKKNHHFPDRRIFARFSIKLPLRFLEKNSEKLNMAESINISGNGIGFISKTKPSLNAPVEMWLDVPDQYEPFYVKGVVIWTKNIQKNIQKWRSGIHLLKANFINLGSIYHLK